MSTRQVVECETPGRDGRPRYVVAQWIERNACYVADMTRQSKRLTGCSQVSSRSADGIAASGNVQVYRSRSAASRACRTANAYGAP